MTLSLASLLHDIASALAEMDKRALRYKHYGPGIGPFAESFLVKEALSLMQDKYPNRYANARIQRTPDLLIPGEWAIELKLARPFGDNGVQAEHWSQNLLHPYPGNTSALGDCLKLLDSNFQERIAIIVIGYEHQPAQISLDPLIKSFELIAREILDISLGERVSISLPDLIHPVHQRAIVIGWEVLVR